MKLGIMQPYFMPYIGYWQLLNAVDQYVIYDDVNYINRGWINRNRILMNNEPKYFNVPMLGASQNKLINEVQVNPDLRMVNKNLRTIQGAYKKAPYFQEVYSMLEKILTCTESNLAVYIMKSFQVICEYLNIETKLVMSSSIKKETSLKGEEKILSICKLLGATEYYNAIGGKELYSFENFKRENIKLKFLKTNMIEYKQFGNDFIANLSIIDVMMFNSKEEIQNLLTQYALVEN